MNLIRNTTIKIHFILDQILPPFLRDSRLFMYLPFKIIFGSKANIFFTFKEKALLMSPEDFSKTYIEVDDVLIKRETDLNNNCINEILKNIVGHKTLEIGCGKALLSDKIEQAGYEITAVDINIKNELKEKYPKIIFEEASAERLPFSDDEFDTVVCTHTLEHVQNLSQAIDEARRVCKKRIIIVVPKQRPYKYTFDLHLHFFPYKYSFLQAIRAKSKNVCKIVGGDIFYIEEK